MGWEMRHGRRYLYRNLRVNGERVKQYVGRDSQAGRAMGLILFHMADLAEEAREKERRASAELRARTAGLLRSAAEANADLQQAAEAMLITLGLHRLNRGRWRMARKTLPAAAGGESPDLPPGTADAMIVYTAPDNVAGAADLFARVRAGDKAAQAELRRWMRETDGQLDHYGDLAMRATSVIVGKITGGDPVWRIAVEEKVKAMTAELLGDAPTVLDRLLVRRVVNGWLCVHALEVESTVRPPRQMRDKVYLEAAIGKASKSFTAAVAELARVRRIHLPNVLVSITPPTSLPPSPPRVAEAEVLESVNVPAAVSDKTASGKKPTARKAPRKSSGETPSRRGSPGRPQQNGDSR